MQSESAQVGLVSLWGKRLGDGGTLRISVVSTLTPALSLKGTGSNATRQQPSGLARLAAAACVLGAVAGCQAPLKPPVLADPIPMRDAVAVVNANAAKIRATLRAAGSVDGYFTNPDGRRMSYHVEGVLFYLAPCYLRFDLKKLGDRQFLFGANAEQFWLYSKEDDRYYCGWRNAPEDMPAEMPVRPDQLIDALGLTPIPEGVAGSSAALVQRVEDDCQQVLFLDSDGGQPVLVKEYWLDRAPPRLVRRVVFRDFDGVLEMQSQLDDYRPLAGDGPLLPHVMTAAWPTVGARMRFQVSKWAPVEQVVPGGPQFAVPPDCTDIGSVDVAPRGER